MEEIVISVQNMLARDDFRVGLASAIKLYDSEYILPAQIPTLYRYTGLTEYTIENLNSNGISLSLIARFNDCYDSTLSLGDLLHHAQTEYDYDKHISGSANYEPCISQDEWLEHIQTESWAYRSFANTSHCCCFTDNPYSTLMWSHYGNNCKGLCVGYDFSKSGCSNIQNSVFPVSYTTTPIDVYDYIHEKKGTFSVEIGVLMSILNKARCWDYEREWRLVLLNERIGWYQPEKYISMSNMLPAICINLGQRFLDNFIPELSSSTPEIQLYRLQQLAKLQSEQGMPVYQMIPKPNTFDQFKSCAIDLKTVYQFVTEQNQLHGNTLRNRSLMYMSYSEDVLSNE